MKASKMTNEELAARLEVHAVPVMGCVGSCKAGREIANDIREAAKRLRRPTPVDDDLLKMARDIDKLNAKLKVAEDALQKIFNKVFVDCIVAEIANNALATIRGEGGAI